jgi:hypothetical protein
MWIVFGGVSALLLALAVLGPLPLAAQGESGLRIEAVAAYEGRFKYGEWLPVWISLENAGRDLEAQVEVLVKGRSGATTYAAPVSLPSGARKRLSVYVLPNNFSRELQVQVVDAQGSIVHSTKVQVKGYPNITFLAGLIAPERGALALIAGAEAPKPARPVVLVAVDLGELPGRMEALRSLDCLVLNDTDTSSLSIEQRAALEAWVSQGGRLVIGGGAGARRTVSGLPESLLPLVPRSEREVDALPGLARYADGEPVRVLGPFLLSVGDLGPGHTLSEQEGVPLVRERTLGTGRVAWTAFDLAGSPLDAWAGAVRFWERLILSDADYVQDMPADMSPREMRSMQMSYALSNLPALDLPSVRGLGILLAVYILLVGPINYLVLRWRKRLHWAWITIPLLTLLFSGGAFALGYALRGTDLILNKIVLVNAQREGPPRVDSYIGLFSPSRQSYEIEVEGGGLLSPIVQEGDPFRGSNTAPGGEMTFVQGNPGRVRGLNVNQWSMQTFMSEDVWPDMGTVESELSFVDGALVGTLRNRTGRMLEDAVVVLYTEYVRVGDLAPGAEAEVRLDLPNTDIQFFGPPISYRLFEKELQQPSPTGPPREIQLKQQILDAALSSNMYSPISSVRPMGTGTAQGLTLIAWLDGAPPEVWVARRHPAQQTTALYLLPLSYHLPESGTISVPAGFVESRVVEMPAEGGPCGPGGVPAVYIHRGESVFEFDLPELVQDVQLEQLVLSLRSEGGWREAPSVAFYDWPADAWSELSEPDFGDNLVSEPEAFVREDGLVRVRLTVDDVSGGSCYIVGVGFEGER